MRPTVLQIGKYYPPQMGGIETHVAALCQSLLTSINVEVVVCGGRSATANQVVDGVSVTRVRKIVKVASTDFCPHMSQVLKTTSADLIHIHLPNPMAVVAYLASGHPGRLIVTYHSDTVRQKVLGTLFQPFLSAVLRRSAAIIATTQNYLDSSETLEPYKDKCHVIPYGVEVSKIVKSIRFRWQESSLVLGAGWY